MRLHLDHGREAANEVHAKRQLNGRPHNPSTVHRRPPTHAAPLLAGEHLQPPKLRPAADQPQLHCTGMGHGLLVRPAQQAGACKSGSSSTRIVHSRVTTTHLAGTHMRCPHPLSVGSCARPGRHACSRLVTSHCPSTEHCPAERGRSLAQTWQGWPPHPAQTGPAGGRPQVRPHC